MSMIEQIKDKTRFQYTIFDISVIVENDEGYITISDYAINMYGTGKTLKEAEEDYKSVVMEYYQRLKSNQDNLGDYLQKHLNYLDSKRLKSKAGLRV